MLNILHHGKSSLILFVFFLYSLFNGVFANDKDSGVKEIWQELYLYHDFGEKFSAGVLFNNLYSFQFGNYDWFIEGGLTYRVRPWLNVEGMFRQEYYYVGDKWVYESRPMIRFSGKIELGNWKIRNRHRFEMRIFEFGISQFRYRSDVRVKPSWNWTKMNLNPYLQEEIFINEQRLSRVRSYFGIMGNKGRFSPMIYGLIQSDNFIHQWLHRLIVGIGIDIKL